MSSVMAAGCGAAPLARDTQLETCKKLGIQQFGQGRQYIDLLEMNHKLPTHVSAISHETSWETRGFLGIRINY